MLKKTIFICILFSLSIFLFGCDSSLPTTTTTTQNNSTTTSTSITTTTSTTSTTSTTTTTILYETFDMSSVFSSNETPQSMTQLNGYLYIATSSKLYKVSTSNPTSPVNQVLVTNNYVSMETSTSPNSTYVTAHYQDPSGNVQRVDYNDSLVEMGRYSSQIGLIPPSAVTQYNQHTHYVYIGSDIGSEFSYASPSDSAEYLVYESGIISLEYGRNNHFYACNPTTIYKYDTFSGDYPVPSSLSASLVGNSSDLIGIAYIDPYIWVIDKTSKKLYRVLDNL